MVAAGVGLHRAGDHGHDGAMATRDPRVLDLLTGREPESTIDVQWSRPMQVSAYLGPAALPEDLVTSVRCLVIVGDQVVLCTNRDGITHAWPGGRREAGETFDATARREVREETGWLLDAAPVTALGFLHLFNSGAPLAPFPHPDVLQLVVVAEATGRAAEDWTDVEGYETSSRLVPLSDAARSISAQDATCVPFLEHLARQRR